MQEMQIHFSGREAKIPHATQPKKNKKQMQYCNKSNKDFKNSPHQIGVFKCSIVYHDICKVLNLH